MKRLLALAICGLLLTGCVDDENLESVEIENATFDLVSDKDTGIIYIENHTYAGRSVYTPYYSKNGKLCRYIDKQIVEVEE